MHRTLQTCLWDSFFYTYNSTNRHKASSALCEQSVLKSNTSSCCLFNSQEQICKWTSRSSVLSQMLPSFISLSVRLMWVFLFLPHMFCVILLSSCEQQHDDIRTTVNRCHVWLRWSIVMTDLGSQFFVEMGGCGRRPILDTLDCRHHMESWRSTRWPWLFIVFKWWRTIIFKVQNGTRAVLAPVS